MNTSTPIIEARDLTVGYGSYVVQKDLNFTINRQDVFIIMGPSGCGKSTLLRVLVGLLQPTKGQVLYRGQDFWAGTESERQKLLSGVGLLFQSGALWSSMTLAENVALPLQRYTKLSSAEIREQTSLKLALVGLAGFEAVEHAGFGERLLYEPHERSAEYGSGDDAADGEHDALQCRPAGGDDPFVQAIG